MLRYSPLQVFTEAFYSVRGLYSLLDHQYDIFLAQKMACILFSLAILTDVWSTGILSTGVLSAHRMICLAAKCLSMKYPYP